MKLMTGLLLARNVATDATKNPYSDPKHTFSIPSTCMDETQPPTDRPLGWVPWKPGVSPGEGLLQFSLGTEDIGSGRVLPYGPRFNT